jgi:uncharacterized protein (TIGR02284 family)
MSESKKPELIDIVRHLLVSSTDGIEGYRRAAQDVKSDRLRGFLSEAAAEREQIAAVLTNLLVSLGFKPSHHGSLEGAIHRRWLDALGAFAPHADDGILRECQRGEQETIAAFAKALDHDLPDEVRSTLHTQLARIFEASAALNTTL